MNLCNDCGGMRMSFDNPFYCLDCNAQDIINPPEKKKNRKEYSEEKLFKPKTLLEAYNIRDYHEMRGRIVPMEITEYIRVKEALVK